MTNAVAMSFAVLIDWSYAGSGAPNFASTGADVTAYVKDINITSGIQDAMSGTAYVGTCSLKLDNSSKRFSPAYTSGPLYGSLKSNKPIKMTITSGATTWTLFRGWLTNISPSSGQYGDRECTIEAKDILGKIQEELVGIPILSNIVSSTLLRHVINYALKATVATAVVTLTGVPSAGNTLVLNDGSGACTLSWVASLTGAADQVLIGADLTACTQNLAAAINKGTGAASTYAGNITLPRTMTAFPVTATTYGDSNYDTPVPLAASAMTGETLATGTDVSFPSVEGLIGSFDGSTWGDGETMTTTQAGHLTTVGLYFHSKTGTPGEITVTVRDGGASGTLLYTGHWTPTVTGGGWQDHTLTAPVYLQASHVYFIGFELTTYPGGSNYYSVFGSTGSSVYAGGQEYWRVDSTPWDPINGDIGVRFTSTAVTTTVKLGQSFQLPATQSVSSLTLYLAKVGVPTGTLTLRIETDSGGSPSGVLADVNATTTLAESSLTTSLADIVFSFASAPVLYASTSYWLVLSTDRSASVANFVVWGADASAPGYTDGVMKSYDGATWNAESKDACFSTGAFTITLYAMLHGTVGNAYTIAKTGTWCTLSDTTFTGGVDEPTDLAPALDTGLNTFQYAGDTWSAEGENATNAMTCIEQIVQSEYLSFFWIARDGTITWKNRSWFPLLSQATPDLTLSSEHNAVDGAAGLDMVYNWVGANYTPPGSLALGAVARSASTIVVPGLTGLTERWNPTQVVSNQAGTKVIKLPYTDPSTGQTIGATSVVTPLAATTDYTAYEFSDKSGWNYTTSPSLHFSVVVLGSGVEITVTNSALGPIYIFDLQCRGVGLTHYQPVQVVAEDSTSQATEGRRAYSFDLPLVSNETYFVGQLVRYLLERFTSTDYVLTSITFVNQNYVNGVNLFSLEFGDVLSVTDAQTGLTTAKYVITGASYTGIGPSRTGSVTFYVRWIDATPRIVRGNAYYYLNGDTPTALYTLMPTTTITGTSQGDISIGDLSGPDQWLAQTFQVSAGPLNQITYVAGANAGSPSGTMTWQICANGSGAPGTVLASGTFTPTPSATNTITVTGGPTLAASTTYWLVLKPTANQTGGAAWTWTRTTNAYANGDGYYTTDGSSWTALGYDFKCTIRVYNGYDKFAQSAQITTDAVVAGVKLYLVKTGTPTGTLTVRVETDSSNAPSGTLVNANATATLAESTLDTTGLLYSLLFPQSVTLTSGVKYWIVLSTDRGLDGANTISWYVDASSPTYSDGAFATQALNVWTVDTTKDACFELIVTDKIFTEVLA